MNKNKGSLTVEACLAMTTFMMVFITILFLMRIVFAYEIVQHALNQTAKEFSTYTYYYKVSGFGDINHTIQDATSSGRSNFNDSVSNIVTVYNDFNKLGGSISSTVNSASSGDISGAISNMSTVSDDYEAAKQSAGAAINTIKSIATDPMKAIKSIGAVLLNGGNELAKTFIFGEISRALMAKYIAEGGYGAADDRLKKLRIEGGLGGLNFGSSRFWAEGSNDEIEFVVYYTIKPVFPIKIIDEINLMNRVRVRGWSGKSIF